MLVSGALQAFLGELEPVIPDTLLCGCCVLPELVGETLDGVIVCLRIVPIGIATDEGTTGILVGNPDLIELTVFAGTCVGIPVLAVLHKLSGAVPAAV